jgi:hypothetical protein
MSGATNVKQLAVLLKPNQIRRIFNRVFFELRGWGRVSVKNLHIDSPSTIGV